MHDAIVSQYRAALWMMRKTIEACPPALWVNEAGYAPFWHIVYHALFYTHLYLQPKEADFVPWPKHRDQYQFIGAVPWPPHAAPEIDEPFDQADMVEYVHYCLARLDGTVARLNLDATDSGFDWLPMGKLELQMYNVRHLQQHIGELCARLDQASILIDWVGLAPAST